MLEIREHLLHLREAFQRPILMQDHPEQLDGNLLAWRVSVGVRFYRYTSSITRYKQDSELEHVRTQAEYHPVVPIYVSHRLYFTVPVSARTPLSLGY